MKKICSLILFLILIGCNKNADKQTTISSSQNELINSYSSPFPENTQLSIAIISDSKVHFFGFIKSRDTLNSVENRDSVFGIGSITKVFTSTLLSRLISDSIVGLNDPIENVLPFKLHTSDYENDKVSFKTLSNHTSGFPRMPANYQEIVKDSEDGSAYDIDVLKDYLNKDLILKSMPGNEYLYSNLGYATLGYLIEHIQRTEYEDLLQKSICNKYGLRSTTTEFTKVKNLVVSGRDSLGNTLPYIDLGSFRSSGGILSNASDLAKFVLANFTDDKLLTYQRKETYNWGNFGMALGWEILKIGGEDCFWYFKDGGLDGYRSSCMIDVSSKNAVIILSNLSISHPNNDNINKLTKELLKLEFLRFHENDSCSNAFIEIALKRGWGVQRSDSLIHVDIPKNSIIGVWQQNKNNRIVTRTFFPDNKVQTDFFNDTEIDVWGYYSLKEDTIVLKDIGGAACNNDGIYQYVLMNDTLHFTAIIDDCDGRRAGLSGKWTRMKQ